MSITKGRLPSKAVFQIPDLSIADAGTANWDSIASAFDQEAESIYRSEVEEDVNRAEVAGANALDVGADGKVFRTPMPADITTPDGRKVFQSKQRAAALTTHLNNLQTMGEKIRIETQEDPNPIAAFTEAYGTYVQQIEEDVNPDILNILRVKALTVGQQHLNTLRQKVQTEQIEQELDEADKTVSEQTNHIVEGIRMGEEPIIVRGNIAVLNTLIDTLVEAKTYSPKKGAKAKEDLAVRVVTNGLTMEFLKAGEDVSEVRFAVENMLKPENEKELKSRFNLPDDQDITMEMRNQIRTELNEAVNHHLKPYQDKKIESNRIWKTRIDQMQAEIALDRGTMTEQDVRDYLRARGITRNIIENKTGEHGLISDWATKLFIDARTADLVAEGKIEDSENTRIRSQIMFATDVGTVRSAVTFYERVFEPDLQMRKEAYQKEKELIGIKEDADIEAHRQVILKAIASRQISDEKIVYQWLANENPNSTFYKAVDKYKGEFNAAIREHGQIAPGVTHDDWIGALKDMAATGGQANQDTADVVTAVLLDEAKRDGIPLDVSNQIRIYTEAAEQTGRFSKQALEFLKTHGATPPESVEEAFAIADWWTNIRQDENQGRMVNQLSSADQTYLDQLTLFFKNNAASQGGEKAEKDYQDFKGKIAGTDQLFNEGSQKVEALKKQHKPDESGRNWWDATFAVEMKKSLNDFGFLKHLLQWYTGAEEDCIRMFTHLDQLRRGEGENQQIEFARSLWSHFGNLFGSGQIAIGTPVYNQLMETFEFELKSTGMWGKNPAQIALQQTFRKMRNFRGLGLSKYAPKTPDMAGAPAIMIQSPEFALPQGRADYMMKLKLARWYESLDDETKKLLPVDLSDTDYYLSEDDKKSADVDSKEYPRRMYRRQQYLDRFSRLIEEGWVSAIVDPSSRRDKPRWQVFIQNPTGDPKAKLGVLGQAWTTVRRALTFSLPEQFPLRREITVPKYFTGGDELEWRDEQIKQNVAAGFNFVVTKTQIGDPRLLEGF